MRPLSPICLAPRFDTGVIVSSAGFQEGAVEAAAYSNVRLLDWNDFQRMFVKCGAAMPWPLLRVWIPSMTRALRTPTIFGCLARELIKFLYE